MKILFRKSSSLQDFSVSKYEPILFRTLQLKGHPREEFILPPNACEDTYQRKAVILQLKMFWRHFVDHECKDYFSYPDHFGAGKGEAIEELSPAKNIARSILLAFSTVFVTVLWLCRLPYKEARPLAPGI